MNRGTAPIPSDDTAFEALVSSTADVWFARDRSGWLINGRNTSEALTGDVRRVLTIARDILSTADRNEP